MAGSRCGANAVHAALGRHLRLLMRERRMDHPFGVLQIDRPR